MFRKIMHFLNFVLLLQHGEYRWQFLSSVELENQRKGKLDDPEQTSIDKWEVQHHTIRERRIWDYYGTFTGEGKVYIDFHV